MCEAKKKQGGQLSNEGLCYLILLLISYMGVFYLALILFDYYGWMSEYLLTVGVFIGLVLGKLHQRIIKKYTE